MSLPVAWCARPTWARNWRCKRRSSMLQIDRMDAYYGLFQALFDVSLQLAPAQTLALIGSNGAGKTTLLRTLA
ncbi:MAG: ATP-binding cassette domain-containing protein, partial [Curvibacter lanceolatus]|nr:ATP-binding cassette domain-containing protein [Curvibacter lanceolatus]